MSKEALHNLISEIWRKGQKMPKVGQQSTASFNSASQRKPNVFENVHDISAMPEEGLKFVFFGPNGTGKTTLACDFPKPLLFVRPEAAEDGSVSVRDVPGISVTDPLTDPDQLSDIIDGQRATKRYKSILVDGAGDFQSLVVKKQMGWQEVPVRQTWGMVSDPDWNRIGIVFSGYLRDLLALTHTGCHILITVGERIIGDRQDDRKSAVVNSIRVPKMMAALAPSITEWLHKVCDYNVYTFTRRGTKKIETVLDGEKVTTEEPGEIEFCARLGAHEFYQTKFRCSRNTPPPEEIVLPRTAKHGELFTMLYNLIKGPTAASQTAKK